MPIQTDLHIASLTAQFRAQKSAYHETRTAQAESSDQSESASEDRVEISLSANMTVETANGIMLDSVVEQINKALQEAGIDLKVEAGSDLDVSPEATAQRIVGFASGFLDAFKQNHTGEDRGTQLRGFMSLTRTAIEDGFQRARSFLEGITKLSETVKENIDQTFALANQYLDDFHQAQLAGNDPVPTGADPSDSARESDAPQEV